MAYPAMKTSLLLLNWKKTLGKCISSPSFLQVLSIRFTTKFLTTFVLKLLFCQYLSLLAAMSNVNQQIRWIFLFRKNFCKKNITKTFWYFHCKICTEIFTSIIKYKISREKWEAECNYDWCETSFNGQFI